MKRSVIRAGLLGLLAFGLTAGGARAESLPTLDNALKNAAPDIIGKAKAKGWQKYGFLKVLVRVGKGDYRDNFGVLNLSLPNRLAAAVILELPDDSSTSILADPNAALADVRRPPSHLNENDLPKFFKMRRSPYRVAWDMRTPVVPDALFTGKVDVADNLESMKVTIEAFSKENPKLETITSFDVQTDLRTLTEMGFSFGGSRGGLDAFVKKGNQEQYTDKLRKVVKAQIDPTTKQDEWDEQAQQNLESMKELPVKLEILYGGKVATVQTNPYQSTETPGVLLRVPGPQEGQKVTFRLRNTSSDTTYGILLRVNGKSTIYGETADPADCYKWILKPNKSVTVTGFQTTQGMSNAFEVLSPEASKANEINYGANLGTFEYMVFPEATEKAQVAMLDKIEAETKKVENHPILAISRGLDGSQSTSPPFSLESLKIQLQQKFAKQAIEKPLSSRGMIGEGAGEARAVKEVRVRMSRMPVYSGTIRYYDRGE